jgi:acetyltransferase-like isoleucine patch superfamily enzyme
MKADVEDRFKEWRYPEIQDGKPTRFHWIVRHPQNFKLGYQTDIGAFTYINAKHGVAIEDRVQIGSHCAIYSISTIDAKSGPVRIRKNAKIGSHCIVMPGVTIGENAVVGAFSFVNADIPEDSLSYGVPVRVIKTLSVDKI